MCVCVYLYTYGCACANVCLAILSTDYVCFMDFDICVYLYNGDLIALVYIIHCKILLLYIDVTYTLPFVLSLDTISITVSNAWIIYIISIL